MPKRLNSCLKYHHNHAIGKEINEAEGVLGDKDKRQQYDFTRIELADISTFINKSAGLCPSIARAKEKLKAVKQ